MSEEIDRWIVYMKEHPHMWKSKHSAFINAQFSKHKEVLEKLKHSPEGRKKIIQIYSIKNPEGYKGLLGQN